MPAMQKENRGCKRVNDLPVEGVTCKKPRNERPKPVIEDTKAQSQADSRWPGILSLLTPWTWFRRGTPALPEAFTLEGCSGMPRLNGAYRCVASKFASELFHDLSTYMQDGGAFYCYYWHDENDEESNGWYFADEVASEDFVAFNPDKTAKVPPARGWLVKGKADKLVFTAKR